MIKNKEYKTVTISLEDVIITPYFSQKGYDEYKLKIMEKHKHEILAEKREKRSQNKKKLVENIIDDLKENIYDSQEYIWDLCRETLMKRTNKELKES